MLRPRWPVRFAVVFVLSACFARSSQAAGDWPVSRGPSREPTPYRYDAGQWRKVPKEFLEDAAACVLYAGSTYLVEPDGTVETIVHEITRLNGRKAVGKIGEYRNITYNPAYQKLTLNEAVIHKADGRRVAVEPRHVQLRDVATDFLVYDRDKTLIISVPGLEVGDVFEAKWTVRGKNPEHGGKFFTRYLFGDADYPVVRDEVKVRLPKDVPFKYAPIGGKTEPAVTEDDQTRTYVWHTLNCKQLTQDENPPSREELRPGVACSTFASWDEVARWKHKLRAECWECGEELRKAVAEITKDITEPIAKARALTYWMRRNVRYVSAGEKHDYTPHLPHQVFANRYGDCKDTSQLLAVMLREAGVKVELATLGTVDDGQVLEDVPSPWGTHAILLATVDGTEHWIDTTASLCAWDFLPRDDRDRLCYLVDDAGKLRLHRTPPFKLGDNRTEQTTHVWVGPDGTSRCEREATFYGSAAVAQRDSFLDVPAGERRRIVANELQDANSRTRLLRLAPDEAALRDLDGPVKLRVAYEIPGHFSGDTELEGNVADSKTWGRLLAYNLDYDRQVAMQFYAPFESRHRYVVHLPPGYRPESVPGNQSVRSRWGSFTARVKTLGDPRGPNLEIEFVTRLENPRVEPADFDAFRTFHQDVSRHYRVWLTLKPVQDLADAAPLEALLALMPEDSTSAALLAKLYLKHNRNAAARRVLERVRYYRPADETLWELTVKAAANHADEEKALRELTRRFPDEPRHALALGATLIDNDKPQEARAVLEPLANDGTRLYRAQAHYHLARGYYATNQPEEALKQLDAAAGADAAAMNTVKAHVLRGRVNEKLGKVTAAVRSYRDALGVDREAEEALDALVRLSLASGDREEALSYLRRYTVVVGDEVSGQLLAADYYLRLGLPDEAFALAARVREKTFHEKAQRITGLVYLRRGDAAKAVEHLDKAELDATVAEALLRASLMAGSLRDVRDRLDQADRVTPQTAALKQTADRARRLLERRDELARDAGLTPKDGDALRALGYAVSAEEALAGGQPRRRVEELLAQSFADGVEVGPALALRARLALEQGKLTKALADAERAVAACPSYPAGYFVRGRVRLERQSAGALADLERAAELGRRRDADVLHALADALYRLGRVQEAVKTQREAVALKPADREMADQLRGFEKSANAGH